MQDMVFNKYKEKVSNGLTVNDCIILLHSEGHNIVESIRYIRLLYNIGLNDAKQVTSAHPVWADVVEANQPLHEDLERLAKSKKIKYL